MTLYVRYKALFKPCSLAFFDYMTLWCDCHIVRNTVGNTVGNTVENTVGNTVENTNLGDYFVSQRTSLIEKYLLPILQLDISLSN